MYDIENFSISSVKITNPFGLTSRQEQNLPPVPDVTLVTSRVVPTNIMSLWDNTIFPKAPVYLLSFDRSCAWKLFLGNYDGLSAIASSQRGNNADYLRYYPVPVRDRMLVEPPRILKQIPSGMKCHKPPRNNLQKCYTTIGVNCVAVLKPVAFK